MSTSIPFLTAGEFYDRVSPVRAVRALRDALRAGFDPAEDHQRISSRLGSGEFLFMPSEAGAIAGIKVLSVAPAIRRATCRASREPTSSSTQKR